MAAFVLQDLPPLDTFSKYVELFAIHGVYFIAMYFLVYQQRRTFNDFKDAREEIDILLTKIRNGQSVNEDLLHLTRVDCQN
jgi:hypothetical protein